MMNHKFDSLEDHEFRRDEWEALMAEADYQEERSRTEPLRRMREIAYEIQQLACHAPHCGHYPPGAFVDCPGCIATLMLREAGELLSLLGGPPR